MTTFTHTEKVVLLHIYGAQLVAILCVMWMCIKILVDDKRRK